MSPCPSDGGQSVQWSCGQINTGRDFPTLRRKLSHALHLSCVTGRKHPLGPALLATLPLAPNDPFTLICFPPLSNFSHWPCSSYPYPPLPLSSPGPWCHSLHPPCALAILPWPTGFQLQPADTTRLSFHRTPFSLLGPCPLSSSSPHYLCAKDNHS